ncbi:MAG: DEAD/DEAH box helicase [Trichlorobacter sp.]|jgi:superfamily II DNA/RNA helicase
MLFTELNLHPSIQKAVATCGYATATPIQAAAIPLAQAGRDLIGSAQTGTGKTAAFIIPALERLVKPGPAGRGPRVLVLTPTRELAIQVADSVARYGRFLRFRYGTIMGGVPYPDQLRMLSQPVDLIVATPGRLIDHLERGRLDLSRVELLVLDEADRMLDMGFTDAVDQIAAATPKARQTLLFTATMDDPMARLAQRLLREPERIAISAATANHDQIEQRLHVTDNLGHKYKLLQHLLEDPAITQAIIFSATKRDADSLARELFQKGYAAAALHGDMTQGARTRTLTNLRRGRVKLLVATDVAARGLDINGISHVINFDLPKAAEDYVHRIGRTGRAGATGIAISFVSPTEAGYLQRIERYTGQRVPVYTIPGLEPVSSLPTGGRGTGKGRRPFVPGGQRRQGAVPKGKGGHQQRGRTER